MKIHADQGVTLTPDSIRTHVYDNGSAYLELGTQGNVGQSILIWAGTEGTNPAEEALALRKLAEVASDLAAGLERRAGTGGALDPPHEVLDKMAARGMREMGETP